jgi:TctA family transporter
MHEVMQMLIGTAGAMPEVFSPINMLYCLTGLVVGIIWGAIPALSSTMAMALLIGFSAGMPLQGAVIFLLAVYSGSVFGGSISAVCINIPGTPAATCTSGAAKADGLSAPPFWRPPSATSLVPSSSSCARHSCSRSRSASAPGKYS